MRRIFPVGILVMIGVLGLCSQLWAGVTVGVLSGPLPSGPGDPLPSLTILDMTKRWCHLSVEASTGIAQSTLNQTFIVTNAPDPNMPLTLLLIIPKPGGQEYTKPWDFQLTIGNRILHANPTPCKPEQLQTLIDLLGPLADKALAGSHLLAAIPLVGIPSESLAAGSEIILKASFIHKGLMKSDTCMFTIPTRVHMLQEGIVKSLKYEINIKGGGEPQAAWLGTWAPGFGDRVHGGLGGRAAWHSPRADVLQTPGGWQVSIQLSDVKPREQLTADFAVLIPNIVR